jgi:hypothetical protein
MEFVTIRGSTTPSVELAYGEERTYTEPDLDHAQRLINIGVAELVEWYTDSGDADPGGDLTVAAAGTGDVESADEAEQ